MYDIVIVGAGPSGLTASIYARRSNKNVLVLESLTYGGQIVNTLDIENYPAENHISGVELANKMYNQALDLGAKIKFEKVIDIKNYDDYKEVITNKNTYKTKTIILSTGSDNRKLNIKGEDELLGKGVSYCATCDGNFYKNKDVAVIGSGITAVEDTIYLSDIVNKVYLINRSNDFKVDENLFQKLSKLNNVELILNSNITQINGKDKLESIELTDKENNKINLNIQGLFIAIGRVPENQNFAKLINLDDKGYIIANENCHTNIDGIFASGDNRTKSLRQLVTATSDGAIAATEAIKYINKKYK